MTLLHPFRDTLRVTISGETKSYGFALVVWGSGSLVAARHGTPSDLDVLAFIAGVLTAMTLMILVAFGGPMNTQKHRVFERYAVGAIHFASVALGLVTAWALAFVGPAAPAFAASGFGAVLVFQALLCAEVAFSVKEPLPATQPGAVDGAKPTEVVA